MLIDCHTHLDCFPDSEVAEIVDRAARTGVGMIVSAGTTLESSRRSVQLSLSKDLPGLFSGVGIHPMDLVGPVGDAVIAELRDLATAGKVVAISEIGLDFMEGSPDRATQYQAFRAQISLAREVGLPVIFHSREAHAETLRVLREEGGYEVGGAAHYFQGDLEAARQVIDLGFYISLARPLLRLPHLQEAAAGVPLEHIVLETDAAPQPFKARRERWTEPRHVRDVAGKLAELQGTSVEAVEAATTRNALRLFEARRTEIGAYVDLKA